MIPGRGLAVGTADRWSKAGRRGAAPAGAIAPMIDVVADEYHARMAVDGKARSEVTGSRSPEACVRSLWPTVSAKLGSTGGRRGSARWPRGDQSGLDIARGADDDAIARLVVRAGLGALVPPTEPSRVAGLADERALTAWWRAPERPSVRAARRGKRRTAQGHRLARCQVSCANAPVPTGCWLTRVLARRLQVTRLGTSPSSPMLPHQERAHSNRAAFTGQPEGRTLLRRGATREVQVLNLPTFRSVVRARVAMLLVSRTDRLPSRYRRSHPARVSARRPR
jgi:hypothetical protein